MCNIEQMKINILNTDTINKISNLLFSLRIDHVIVQVFDKFGDVFT